MNPIKITIKSEIFSFLILAISWAASFYFYQHFPDRVITHWNVSGQPDGWSGKGFAAFFFPGLLSGIYLMFLFLPLFDPNKNRYVEFSKVYDVFRNIILGIMALIYFVASISNLGVYLNVGIWVTAAIGLLFVTLGNYMGKIKRNWFVGIRTPWTLSSESVWNKTHRFGGKTFIMAGVLIALSGVVPLRLRLPLFVLAIMIVLFGTVVYSYLVYLAEKKKK
jgi:uncharacterized membrane protein